MKRNSVLLGLLLLTGCATGPRFDTGPGGLPPVTWGWNIGAGDLLDPSSAGCRLGVYLDELTAQGYAKQIRIVFTPQTGPFQLRYWLPVIRAKWYRVLAILSQGGRPSEGYDNDLTIQQAWVRDGLSQIIDILDGVQPANEPDGFSGKTPAEYAIWHRAMVQEIRHYLPNVPIISPDLRGTGAWNRWVLRTGLVYRVDYDVVSLHVTHQDDTADSQHFINAARTFTGVQQPRVWITEGDWGQAPVMADLGLPIERSYIYVWNCNMGGFDSTCEPETRRPQGGIVEACQGQ